jgi:archaellum component FlaF (FlaF/FlaG flagellin family)
MKVKLEKMRRTENKRRPGKMGISGALVTILLVVVAIAFVGIAVAVLSGFIGTGSVKTDIMVEKLDLVANGYSVIVLRNSGNVKINSIDEVKLVCQGETVSDTINFNPISIDPGKTSMATFTATLIPGQTCTLTVKATAANGAMVATSSSAIVRP